MTESTINELLKQGGFFAICLVLMYFYRKDFASWVRNAEDDKKILIETINNNTEALTSMQLERVEVSKTLTRLEITLSEINSRGRHYDSHLSPPGLGQGKRNHN